jgi:uncharacterized protein with beta-barrel porin domain
MALAYSIDFAPQGLNENQSAIGNYINAIQLAGGSATLAPIVATLFGMPDAQGLADGYNHLTPEVYSGYQATTLASNLQFSNAMLSCRTREGQFRFVREGECGWMTIAGNALHQERTSSNLGFNRNAFTVAGGFQKGIGGNWHLGIGLGYERSWLDVGSLASSRGHQVQGGLVAKGQLGATSFSASITGGHGWYDAKRFVNLPTPGVTAKSDPQLSFVLNRFRLAHDFEQKSWYARPMADLGIAYIYSHRFNERGAGAANLDVRSENETYITLSPALEVGGEIALAGGVLIRPFAKVGLTHLFTGNTPGITASLQGAPAGVAPFTVTGKNDKNYGDVSLGLDVLNTSGVNVRLGYTGQFSKRTKSHGGHLKLSIPF